MPAEQQHLNLRRTVQLLALSSLVPGATIATYVSWQRTILYHSDPVIFAVELILVLAFFGSLLPWRRLAVKFAASVIFFGLLCGATWFGEMEAQRAFNECVDRQADIREQLARFRSVHGHFPESLVQALPALPCRPFGRPTLLDYKSDGITYTLSFSDNFVVFMATETLPFMAHK